MQHKSRRTSKQPELCKHETQKGWKKYLNEAWMWIQINICGVVQTQCLWLSPWWFLPLNCCKRLRPALWPSDGDCSLLFKSWERVCLYSFNNIFMCVNYLLTDAWLYKWVSCRRERYGWNIFWNSEYVHRSCLQMPRVTVKQVFSPCQIPEKKKKICNVWVKPKLLTTLAVFQILAST